MRTLKVNSVDVGGAARMDFSFTQGALRGEVGVGGITFDDPASALTIDAWKTVTVDEALASASGVRVFTGFTGIRNLGRGGSQVVSTDRQWDVDCADLNVLLGDRIFTSTNADRDSETDFVRVTWLISSGKITDLTYGDCVAGVLPNTNTAVLDAADYRGKTPLDVLNDCAEASGKNFFLYYTGGNLSLYYDLSTGTSLTSSQRISNDASDQNGTTWYPVGNWRRTLDPTNVFSDIEAEFGQDPFTGRVIVSNGTTGSNFKIRQKGVRVDNNTADGTTIVANQFLDAASAETETISGLGVQVTAAFVNEFQAGQRIQVKLNGAGLPAFVYRRITRRTVQPFGDSNDEYLVALELMDKTKSTRFVGGPPRVILDDEKIVNGDFEFGPQQQTNRIRDWVVESGNAFTYDAPNPATTALPLPKSGNRALRVMQNSQCIFRTEDFAPVEGGEKYLFRGFAMWNVGASAPTQPTVRVRWYDHTKTLLATTSEKSWRVGDWSKVANLGKWQKFMFLFHAPETAKYRRLVFTNPAGTVGRFTYFDQFSFHSTELTSPPSFKAVP